MNAQVALGLYCVENASESIIKAFEKIFIVTHIQTPKKAVFARLLRFPFVFLFLHCVIASAPDKTELSENGLLLFPHADKLKSARLMVVAEEMEH